MNIKIKSAFKILFAFMAVLAVFGSCKKKSTVHTAGAATNASGSFTVLAFTPEGELPSAVKFPSIQVQFSEPVVALQKLGEPADSLDMVSIEPPLKGVFRWYGTSLLSFECAEGIIPQKEYTVKVNPKTVSLNGNTISGQLLFSFHTEELKMTSIIAGYGAVANGSAVDQDDVPLELACDIAVFFNTTVNADVVSEYLTIKNAYTDFPFTAKNEKDNCVRVTVEKSLPQNQDIVVYLAEGARADEGFFATTTSQASTFHTLRPFTVQDFNADARYYTSNAHANPVKFHMSHELKQGTEADVAACIVTEPPMEITAQNISLSGKNIIVHDLPVTFDSEYKIRLTERLTDVYGLKLELVAEDSWDVQVPSAASFAYFKDHGFKMLEAQFAPKLAFEHQNIKPESLYTVSALADARGKKSSAQKTFKLDPDTIPQNVKIVETVDLAPFLENTNEGLRGAVAFDAEMYYQYKYTDWWNNNETSIKIGKQENNQVVQVTDLGLSARYGYNRAAVLVTSLKTGEPVANATVTALSVPQRSKPKEIVSNSSSYRSLGKARTNEKGFAVIEFAPNAIAYMVKASENLYIEAKTENDRAIFQPEVYNMWRTSVRAVGSLAEPYDMKKVAFLFTDRGLYKPGETVTYRGIDRTLRFGEYSPYTGNYTVKITDGSWNAKVYAEISGSASANGTFYGSWKVPEDLEPGVYQIVYEHAGEKTSYYNRSACSIQVQFFERLRFEANASIPALTYFSGDRLDAEIAAQYLGGGSLGGCQYEAIWSREPVGFSARGAAYEGYRFGPIQGYDGRTTLNEDDGVLNGDGKGVTSQQTGGEKLKGMAYAYRMEAHVTDSGNQMISAASRAVVHPAKFYLGVSRIKNAQGFPKKGDTLKFNYVCLAPDESVPSVKDAGAGKKLNIEMLREDWKQVQQVGWDGQINTRYQREMVSELATSVPLTVSGTGEFSVVPPKGGAYLLRLTTQDAKGNEVVTETKLYVTSSDWYWFARDNAQEITMTCDKDMYAVGETAHILMQSQLQKGTYMLTVEREGILSQEVLTINEPTSVIDVEIKDQFVPVMYVTLSSFSLRTESPAKDFDTPDLGKPKGYFGLATLMVDPEAKRFDVSITTDKPSYRPGERATISLHASKNGMPVQNAEITLMAVDRGVIDLINYHVPDPVAFFYSSNRFPDCVKGGDSRSLLIDPVTYEIKNLLGGDMDDGDSKLNERKNFDPTALFVPSLVTDQNGNVQYEFTLPDSLTAYRITAVGVNQNAFSLNESEMPVAEPVSVRHVLPRKLRLGDVGELGVTVSNLDAADHEVSVELNVYEGIEKTGAAQDADAVQKLPGGATVSGLSSKTLSVRSNSTQPLMFMLEAKKPGWITVEYVVKSDVVNERILLPLEIEKPYIFESVVTVGEVRTENDGTAGTKQELIVLPKSADDGRGELYVQLDSSRLGVLHDAVDYVFRYPYGCLEQRSAFVLPLVAFGEYLTVFGLQNEVKNPNGVVKREIKQWAKSQLVNGAFPYWPGGQHESKTVSMRIGEIIAIARDKGISVGNDVDVKRLASFIKESCVSPSEDARGVYQSAYAYYVAQRLGVVVADSELAELDKSKYADLDSLAFVALTYLNKGNRNEAKRVATKLRRFAKYSARGVELISTQQQFSRWSYLNDESERYALLLNLFCRLNPDDDINQRLVYELLVLQKAGNGYWKSTAATSRVLIALDSYIHAENLADTNFTAEALLGGTKLLDGKFKGMAAESVDTRLDFTDVPLKNMSRDKETPLVFSKKGTGTLFYTVAMKYAIPAKEQNARDEGLCIFTEITDVKTGEVVSSDKLVAGNVYRQKVFITSTRNREYVAVRSPVPAGCEIMNAAFTTTGTLPQEERKSIGEVSAYSEDGWDFSEYWYEDYNYGLSHQAIYDNEVQYFWDYFPRGNQQVQFLFRAARKGTFNTPSSTAECMYQEEIFGRSAGKVWKVQ